MAEEAHFFNTHGVQHRDFAIPLTLALGTHLALRSHRIASRLGDDLARYFGERAELVLLACAASVVLCAGVLGWSLGGGRGHATRSPRYLVSGACLVVVWIAGYQAFGQPYSRVTAVISFGLVFGAHALAVGVGALVRWRVPAAVVKAGLAVCGALVVAELALAGIAAVDPRPLFATGSASERALVDSFRFEPGLVRFGTPTNASGYYDQPFLPAESRTRPMVAVVGDSFVAGTVPLADMFHTVAERALGDVDVYAFGVSAVGVPEYRYLIEREVLPLRPDAVVVSIYVGNDLLGLVREPRPDRLYARLLDRQQLLLRAVPERLLAVRAERRAGGLQVPRAEPERAPADPQLDPASPERLAVHFPWLTDPMREPATMSEQAYADLVASIAKEICLPHRREAEALAAELRAIRALCGDIPLGFVIHPAELQVEESVWRIARVSLPEQAPHLMRDLLQEELRALLDLERLPYVDLLPALRAEPALPDGNRHLFHLRDSHYNVRGNAIAGRELAALVERLLDERAGG